MADRTPAERIAELEAAIEADRTRIIDAVNGLDCALNSRFWLTEGRGSYEWNDDRYREEFGDAARAVLKALEPLRKIGADLTNCPQTTAEVIKARADKDKRIAEMEARLAMVVEAGTQLLLTLREYGAAKPHTVTGRAALAFDEAKGASEPTVAAFIARVERRGAARATNELAILRNARKVGEHYLRECTESRQSRDRSGNITNSWAVVVIPDWQFRQMLYGIEPEARATELEGA